VSGLSVGPGWSLIAPFSRGAGRTLALLYNPVTGKARSIEIQPFTGAIWRGPEFQLAPGWDHIVYCHDRLVFLSESTGTGSVWKIEYEAKPRTITGFPAGRMTVVSDARRILAAGSNRIKICRPTDYSLDVLANTIDTLKLRATTTAGAGLFVDYVVRYREQADVGVSCIDAAEQPRRIASWGGVSPNWTMAVPTNGQVLMYDSEAGDGWVASAASDSKWEFGHPVGISAFWTHLVSVGSWLLFYAEYDGTFAAGFLAPDGTFSGEIQQVNE